MLFLHSPTCSEQSGLYGESKKTELRCRCSTAADQCSTRFPNPEATLFGTTAKWYHAPTLIVGHGMMK
eukprot:10647913-Karenia_brevis.AAC.1